MSFENVEFKHLRAFVSVADKLSFSRAADELNISQQSLSVKIQHLEKILGVQLFHRSTRKVDLTAGGSVLLGHARQLLADLSVACEETHRAESNQANNLVIGYTTTLVDETVSKLVEQAHRTYPNLVLRMCEMWQSESSDAVRHGRIDIGMARCPESVSELNYVKFREESIGVIIGSDHELAQQPSIRAQDLNDMTLGIWPRFFSPGFFDLVVESLRERGFTGVVREFEYMNASLFRSDLAAKQEIAEGKSFYVAFATQMPESSSNFVWKPLVPDLLIPVQLYFRKNPSENVKKFLEIVESVSTTHHWLPR